MSNATDFSQCVLFPPTLPITYTESFHSQNVCGLPGNGSTTNLQQCCGGSVPPLADGCWAFCPYNGTLRQFVDCVYNDNDTAADSAARTQAFCQGIPDVGFRLNHQCASDTSAAVPGMKTPTRSTILILLLASLFLTGAVASPLDSLGSLLLPRAESNTTSPTGITCSADNTTCYSLLYTCGQITSDNCTSFTPSGSSYTRTSDSFSVVGELLTCSGLSPCYFDVPISGTKYYLGTNVTERSPIMLNRTLNGQQAADGMYDGLFGLIARSQPTQLASEDWKFVPTTNFTSTYQYAATQDTTLNVYWTYRCINGTVRGCAGGLNLSNGTEVEACEVINLDGFGVGPGDGTYSSKTPKVSYNVVIVV